MKWLVAMVVLLLFTTAAAWGAAPTIRFVDLMEWREAAYGQMTQSVRMYIAVSDEDGFGDISSIAVNGITYPAEGQCQWYWGSQEPNDASLSICGSEPLTSLDIVVTDSTGLQDTLSTTPPPMQLQLIDPPDWTEVEDPDITFSWAGTFSDGYATLFVGGYPYGLSWVYDIPSGVTSVPYNADGTATAPLEPGHSYEWYIHSDLDVTDATDPRLTTHLEEQIGSAFYIHTEAPIFGSVQITRNVIIGADRNTGCQTGFRALIGDEHGWQDITSVTATGPDGSTYTLPLSGPCFQHYYDNDIDVCIPYCRAAPVPGPAPAGAYTLTAVDSRGNTTTITSAAVDGLDGAQALSPAPDAVIDTGTPTFAWELGAMEPPTQYYEFRVAEEGGPCGCVWYPWTIEGEEAVYNFDGTATRPELLPGHTYLWTVGYGLPEAMEDVVSVFTYGTMTNRVTIYEPWPALPELPGRLTYTDLLSQFADGSIVQYQTDPWARGWIGPVGAEYPAWSPDGSKLAYSNGPIWVDARDGSAPVAVSADAIDPAWSPDGAKLVYSDWNNDPESYGADNLWVSNADGSEAHVLLDQPGQDRYPAWSPDGKWISYRRSDGTEGQFLWLVRPDGAGNHPLLGTDIVGYPGYQVGYMGNHKWSPDGKQLVVEFSGENAAAPELPSVAGIGIISAEGGPLTPVFVAPPGITCCAAPQLPVWSPDGKRIVFSSGHHLSLDPDAQYAVYQPGVELWMVNAHAASKPVRLTYDYSFDGHTSWWGPDTLVGSEVSVTRGDATVTFANVLAEGNTAVCVADAPAAAPAGYVFLGDCWKTATTAQVAGEIAVALGLNPASVPAGQEPRLLGFDGSQWVDITVGLNQTRSLVRGQAASLTHFALATRTAPTLKSPASR